MALGVSQNLANSPIHVNSVARQVQGRITRQEEDFYFVISFSIISKKGWKRFGILTCKFNN